MMPFDFANSWVMWPYPRDDTLLDNW